MTWLNLLNLIADANNISHLIYEIYLNLAQTLAMARLLLLLLPIVVSSTDSSIRGDVQFDHDEYPDIREFDEFDGGCGGAFDNGLDPDCEPEPECDVAWCRQNCDRNCTGDEPCQDHVLCEVNRCPCPLFKMADLNISVSCATSQTVMEFDLSKLVHSDIDTNQMSVSITVQVRTNKLKQWKFQNIIRFLV